MKKYIFVILILLNTLNAYTQVNIQLLNDSVGVGYSRAYSLATFSNKLYLLRSYGGPLYRVDTSTGALQPFARLDSVSGYNMVYSFPAFHFSGLNNRIPVTLTKFLSNGSEINYVLGVGSGKTDTLVELNASLNRYAISDTLMWFSAGAKLYKTNLSGKAIVADSIRGIGSRIDALMAGHKGVYYMTTNKNTTTGFDSVYLFFHNGTSSRLLLSNANAYYRYLTIGTLNGDFYFLQHIPSSALNSIVLYRVSANGTLTTSATIGPGRGVVEQVSSSVGAGKIWFNFSFRNSPRSNNIYSYAPNDTGIVQVTNHINSLIPLIGNHNVSPDSFLYYTVTDHGGPRPDTLYRLKTTGNTPQLYGLITSDLLGIQFADSTAYELRDENASFCKDTLLYQPFQTDSVWIGNRTAGMVFAGLADSVDSKIGAMIKVDNKFFFLKEHLNVGRGSTFGILRLTGCGMQQIPVGTSQVEYLSLNTWPNPSTGRFQIIHNSINHTSKVQLRNLEGKRMPIDIATGTGVIEVTTHSVPAGVYIIDVTTNTRTYTQRVQIL
jgi:hypothetical protein